MRNGFVLNVQTMDFEDMGYNLKRDGWLNSFTDEMNQSIREDGVPWRVAREKLPEFFSIIFSALTDKDDIIMDWQCDLGSVFLLLFFSCFCFLMFSFFIYSFNFPFIPLSSPYPISLF